MTDIAITIPCHMRTVRGLEEPRVFINDGVVVASSEDVAAYFGKRHDHVLRDIRSLISNNISCAPNFGETHRDVKMPTGGTRPVAVYNMTRDGLTLLAMGFTGKRALGWKLKYIEAFNRMEAELAKPRQVYDDEPAPKRQRDPHPARIMDTALDLIVTAETALLAKDWHDKETLLSIIATLEQARKLCRPARAALDRAA